MGNLESIRCVVKQVVPREVIPENNVDERFVMIVTRPWIIQSSFDGGV